MDSSARSLSDLIQALEDEGRARAREIQAINHGGDQTFANLLGLIKSAMQQDVDFMRELAVHVRALGDDAS